MGVLCVIEEMQEYWSLKRRFLWPANPTKVIREVIYESQ